MSKTVTDFISDNDREAGHADRAVSILTAVISAYPEVVIAEDALDVGSHPFIPAEPSVE